MNLRQLEILHAIVTYNTTIAAAKVLGMSQPAISNAIKRMEEQIGFALFQRENNRIFPTPEARLIIQDSQAIFDIHNRMESRIKDIRNNRSGQLRIAATPPLGYGVVAAALERAQAARPKVRAFFDVQSFEEVIHSIEAHQSELGFVLNFSEHPGVASETIYRGEMTCIMSAGHPLHMREAISPADLAGHRLIGLEGETQLGHAVRAAFHDAGVDYVSNIETRYTLSARRIVEIGNAVAIVDPLTASAAAPGLIVARPFLPSIPITASALWAGNRTMTRIGKAFLTDVRAEFDRLNTDQARA